MQYIRLGRISSEEELKDVAAAVKGKSLDAISELMELLKTIGATEEDGFEAERKRWSDSDEAPGLYVYVGDRRLGRGGVIWAAIEVAEDGHTVTLLKITNGFDGDPVTHANLLGDAHDRQDRGVRYG